jgi:hypothetical protein
MTPEARTVQRKTAMVRANQTRAAVAELKADIAGRGMAGGCLRAAEFLDDPGSPADAVRVFALLKAVTWLGEAKVWLLLDMVGVRSGDRRVRELTARQRHALAASLRMKAMS